MKRPEFKRWLDFGSGGGFPAVPLAVLDVGESWTLVESRRTKTLFLRRCVQEMGLGQLDIQLMRLEDYVLDQPEPAFDAFTSRATLTLGPTLELAAAIVRPGGSAFLWKGSRRESEMAEPGTWQQSWTLAGERAISDGQTVVLEFSRRG